MKPSACERSHEAGPIAELETRADTNERGRDLTSLNAGLVYDPSVNSMLEKLIVECNRKLSSAPDKGKLLNTLLSDPVFAWLGMGRRLGKPPECRDLA